MTVLKCRYTLFLYPPPLSPQPTFTLPNFSRLREFLHDSHLSFSVSISPVDRYTPNVLDSYFHLHFSPGISPRLPRLIRHLIFL